MTLPQSYLTVLLVMIFGTALLGLWASVYRLGGNWRFEIFYLDFAFGAFLAAVICAFTLGDLGFDGFSIMDDISHARKRQLFCAVILGVVFNLGNLFMVSAMSIGGMSLAFPVTVGLTILTGVVVAPMLRQSSSPLWLALGCAAIAIAIMCSVLAYQRSARARYVPQPDKRKYSRRPSFMKAPVLAVVGGLILTGLYPLRDIAREGETGLGPYGLVLLMSVGMLVSCFVFVLFFMNLPVEGEPLEVGDILKVHPKNHLLGLISGVVWTGGAIATAIPEAQANIPASAQLSPALVFGLTQASALVAAFLGVTIWNDQRGGDRGARSMSAAMLLLYAGGIALIAIALMRGKAA
jgi:glucose uptake protein